MLMLKWYAVEKFLQRKATSTKDQKVQRELGGRKSGMVGGVLLTQKSSTSRLRYTKDPHTVKAQSMVKDREVEDTEARGRG